MRSVLSARQEECLRLTAFRTDREIAAVLGISEATVKKHVHEACHRLGVTRRKAALAMLAPGDAPGLNPASALNPTPAVQAVAPVQVAPVQVVTVAPAETAQPAPVARLGYRAPPRNALARAAMIAGLAVVLMATTTTLTHMMADYHRTLGRFDATGLAASATVSRTAAYN